MHPELERAQARHPREPLAPSLQARQLGSYRGYSEFLIALGELEAAGARLSVIGRSSLGEPLFQLELGARAGGLGSAGAPRPVTALLSGVHPIEWIGVETQLALLGRLVEAPPARLIRAVPLVNPDGYRAVERNLRAGRRKMVRHNARGVDLNRNFPAFWGRKSLARLLLGPLFARGTGPASEPELKALLGTFCRERGATQGQRIDRALSLHSFGGVVLLPYGAVWRRPALQGALESAAKSVAARIAEATGGAPYRVLQSSRWVPGFTAPGMELDWFYAELGALSLLIECGKPRFRAAQAARLLEPFAWFNPQAPDVLAEQLAAAIEPFVRGEG